MQTMLEDSVAPAWQANLAMQAAKSRIEAEDRGYEVALHKCSRRTITVIITGTSGVTQRKSQATVTVQ
jgi:hypothetical protein